MRTNRRSLRATRRQSFRRALRCRPLFRRIPGGYPALDFVMRNAFALIERGDRLLDTRDLPLVRVEVFFYCLCGEVGAAAGPILLQLFLPLLNADVAGHSADL